MIPLTRLDGTPFLLNLDRLQQVERTPDTLLTTTNGETLMVRETPEDVVARVIEFKRAVAGKVADAQSVIERTRAIFGEAQS